MEINSQTIINIAIWVAIGTGGWFAREVWGAVKELQKSQHEIEVDLPRNYVRKDEFTEAIRRIEVICERIFDKLDGKADK